MIEFETMMRRGGSAAVAEACRFFMRDDIRALKLPAEMEQQLNPYVREKYRELWQGAASDSTGQQ